MKATDPITPEMGYAMLIQCLCFLAMVPLFVVAVMPSQTLYEVVAGFLAVITFCARRQEGASTYNGCGTKFYGDRILKEGSITTKWVTVGHLPIVPVRSYFLYSGEPPSSDKVLSIEVTSLYMHLLPRQETANVFVCPLPRLFWPQVLPILFVPLTILGVIPALFHFVLMPPRPSFAAAD